MLIYGTAADITERKHREANLAFLAEVSQDLVRLTNIDETMNLMGAKIASYLDLSACAFAELDETAAVAYVNYGWHRSDVLSLLGTYRMEEFMTTEVVESCRAGEAVIVRDAFDDPRFNGEQYAALNIGSFVSIPLVRNGKWHFLLVVCRTKAYNWRDDEIGLIREITNRVWTRLERARAEEALAESEEKYRTLFDSIDEGFALEELMYDDAGKVTDAIFREVNAAYERQSGFTNVVGKRMSELMPGLEQYWMDMFTQVAKTREPVRYTNYAHEIDRWFETYITMVAGSHKYLAVVFSDVTGRKRHEANLAFLAETSADFAPLASAGAIMQRVGGRLAKHLKLSRCLFSVVDEEADQIEVIYEWKHSEHLPSLTGVSRISEHLTEEGKKHYAAGRMHVLNGMERSPLMNAPADVLKQRGLGSLVDVPHLQDGRWKFLLTVAHAKPGDWREDELALIQELTSRIYIRIERAHAEEALQQAHTRISEILESIGDVFYALDKDFRYTYVNSKAEEAWGMDREEVLGKTLWEAFPHSVGSESGNMHRQVMESREVTYYETISPILKRWISVSIFPSFSGGLSVFFHDIEERKQAEQALRISETRARTLADAIPHVIWTNTADGIANYFNRRWYEYTGLTYEQSEGLGWEAIVHPDDAAASKERWRTALEDGQVFDTEYRLRRHDGTYRWFIGRNVPLRNDAGQIISWFGSATDIEDLKQAQEQLVRSEERLRVTTESAIDYTIISMDAERIVQGWSRGSERIFGYTEQEAIGKIADIIFTPEDRAAGAPQAEMETARDEGMSPDERWHLRKDGTRFYMSGVMRPIYNNGIISGYVKVARDMTKNKEAEETLRLSEERYRAALQSAEMAAWDWDVVADRVVWNDQHYLILGLKPHGGDKDKDADYFISFVHPEDVALVTGEVKRAVAESGLYRAEFRIIRADNKETRWMSSYGSAVSRDESGRATRMVGVMYDITRRKRVEEQKEEFIGIASHELKTPLTSIKAYSEVLQDMFNESGDEHSAKLMEKMEGQIDRLTSLVRALLDVTRIREGRLELQKEPFGLDGLVRELVEEMQLTTPIKLRTDDISPATIHADRKSITQVVINLLSNAIKYARGTEHIDLSIRVKQDEAVVCIRDYGIGMSKEVSEQVFERFYRAQDAAAGTYPGLGLGLYISAEIVRLHGGRIWVDSEVGEGSVFCFSLPLRH